MTHSGSAQKLEKIVPSIMTRIKLYQNFASCTEEAIANDLLTPRGMALAHLLLAANGLVSMTSISGEEDNAGGGGGSGGCEFQSIVLGKICNEGDNSTDGRELAVEIINAMELLDTAVSFEGLFVPESWKTVYGKDLEDDSMFY